MSFSIPAPYSPAQQASVLWKTTAPVAEAEEKWCRSAAREDDVSRPRVQHRGGLNVESHDADIVGFYDPRTV